MACVMTGPFLLAQAEFSADVVNATKEDNAGPTKLYFGKEKLRIEQADPETKGTRIAIVTLANQKAVFLMPEQHMYVEMPQSKNPKTLSFFRARDAQSACSEWLKLEPNRGGSCRKVGPETVNGRSAIKYQGNNAKGDVDYIWIDSKLRFPVKWQGKPEQSGELRNIQEGPQPADLFEIPADYAKLDLASKGRGAQKPQH
jgi:hypothetical protein